MGAVAPGLKSIEDARLIRGRFLLAFERAEIADNESERRKLLTFVIVGGGPTGVEMAGSIAEVANRTLRSDFRRIDPATSRIVLIEAGPRILPALPENLSRYAQRALEKMGVEVLLNTAVTDCDRNGVSFAGGRIDSATVVWAAGVAASPAAQWIDAEHDRAGRIKVDRDLSVPSATEYLRRRRSGVGAGRRPAVRCPASRRRPNRWAVISGNSSPRASPGAPIAQPFVYRHSGDLATIGRKAAVVKLGRFELTGFIGWLFWGVAHIYFLIGIRNRFVIAVTWLWSYLTFRRGARLISVSAPDPRARN